MRVAGRELPELAVGQVWGAAVEVLQRAIVGFVEVDGKEHVWYVWPSEPIRKSLCSVEHFKRWISGTRDATGAKDIVCMMTLEELREKRDDFLDKVGIARF